MIAGITYNFLPFMVLPLYVSLEQIDHRLIEAAEDLYASRAKAFMRITFPLSLPGVFAGVLLTFIPAAGDFINAQLLGTPRQYMIGNVIQSEFLAVRDYPTAASLSFILMAAILVMVLVFAKVLGTDRLTVGSEIRPPSRPDGVRELALAYLFLPIAVVIAFSFNDPAGSLQLHLAGVHAEELGEPLRLSRACRARSR